MWIWRFLTGENWKTSDFPGGFFSFLVYVPIAVLYKVPVIIKEFEYHI